MEKRPLSREKLRNVCHWKCQLSFLLSPKNLSFSSICQAQYQHNFLNTSTILTLLYMNIFVRIYI